MRMIFLIFAIAVVCFCSCQENDRLLYDEGMHDIYYADVTDTKDSVYISLLTAEEVSVANVQLKLLGNVLSSPLKFKVEVVQERTDAIEGVHYQKLPEYYEFPAGEFTYGMPITLLKGGPTITERPVTLTLRLVGTEELGIAYANRAEIRLQIADMLRKPEGDGYYGDMYRFKVLFGEYSKTKHLMIIEMVGHDFWDNTEDLMYPQYPIYSRSDYYKPYARRLCKFIMENEIEDENGKIMQGWNVQ